MRGTLGARGALVALVLLVGVVVVAAPPARSGAGVGAGVTLVADATLSADGRLHELTVRSDALGRTTNVRILLPAGYDDPADAATRYPVLLLVHGANSDERSWTDRTDVTEHSADDDVIIVMPEGGTLGFYSDWRAGPQWETYHLDELLPWVESTYRAVGTREGRAIAGVSMGGFGAMSYATRHPDRFAAVASFSGVVDLAGLGVAETAIIQLLAPPALWGPILSHEANWRTHNPADLAGNLRGPVVRHTTGTGIPCPGDNPAEGIIEAIILVMNLSLDAQLTAAGVEHELVVRPCGTHENRYGDRDIAAWLTELEGIFADPPPVPAAFDFRSAEPSFDVWGWSFATDRPAIELLDVRDVSAAGLVAVGSGSLDVLTPPVYEPGATYTVTSSRAGLLTVPVGRVPALAPGAPSGPPTTASVVADGDGRLRFTVDLGPAHTANQFSPEGVLAETLALGTYFQSSTVTIAATGGPAAAPAPTPSASPTPSAPSSSPTPLAALPTTGGGAALLAPAASAVALALAARTPRRRPDQSRR